MAPYQVGDTLPTLVTPAVGRLNVAYMAVAMRDPNLVHLEPDVAAEAGLPSVIAHGTFAVAYLGMVVSRHVGVAAVRRLQVDLLAPVFPGDQLTVTAVVTAVAGRQVPPEVEVALEGQKPDGTVAAKGRAVFVQPII
jgi:acyl dehydratase